MAAPRGKAIVTGPAKADPEAELPTIQTFGLVKTPRGWVVVGVQVQGMRVVAQEILSEPEPVSHSAQRAQNAIVAEFVKPKVGA